MLSQEKLLIKCILCARIQNFIPRNYMYMMHVHLFFRREWSPTNNHDHNFTVQILTCDLHGEFSAILLKEGGISRTFLTKSVKFLDCLRFLLLGSIKLFIIIAKWSSLVVLKMDIWRVYPVFYSVSA
jgi:hypothetical protein